MSGRHWSHDWHGFDDDEDRSEFMCHYCEICTCHSPEKTAGACDRLAEVERAVAEKAWWAAEAAFGQAYELSHFDPWSYMPANPYSKTKEDHDDQS